MLIHYLNQCWPSSMSLFGVTRPQCVKLACVYVVVFCFVLLWLLCDLFIKDHSGYGLGQWEKRYIIRPPLIGSANTQNDLWFTHTNQGCFTGLGLSYDFPSASEIIWKNMSKIDWCCGQLLLRCVNCIQYVAQIMHSVLCFIWVVFLVPGVDSI